MSDSNLYLSLREGSQAGQRRDTTVRWVKGRVTDTSKTDPTLPEGWVRVGMPYNSPDTYVVGETPGLYTWQGAMVTVRLHPDGTLLSIGDAQDEPNDTKTSVERLGPAGRDIANAMNDAVDAKKAADEVKTKAEAAVRDAAAAARDAQEARAKAQAASNSVGTVKSAVDGLDSRVTAADEAAKGAAKAAAAAKTTAASAEEIAKRAEDAIKNSNDNAKAVALAEEAKSLAQAAQTLAGQANTKAQDAAAAAADATQKADAADTAAKKADANATAVKATADGAQAAAKAAQADAQKAQADYAALKARQDASTEEIAAAKSKADGAASAAQAAAEKADKATADALGARNAADQAAAKMTSLDGKVTIAARAPLPADGQGKTAGSLWWVQGADGKLGRAFTWNGTVWTPSPAGTNFIGDKAITSAQIGDAQIGAAQIADASITDAKIGGLSVSKLMVTGGARMPQAVIDVITSDSAFLGAVAAHSVSVDPENMVKEPLFSNSPSTVWTAGGGGTVTLAATVSGAPGALVTGVRFSNPLPTASWGQVTQKVTFPAGKRWVLRMTYRYNSGNSGTLVATASAKEICRPVYKANDYSWRTEEWQWAPDSGTTSAMLQLSATAGCKAEVAFVSLTEAVGATQLAPGSVTSDAIYASRELWAKLAAFASVTTDMLTAGNATITGNAVVGDLKGNNIFGSKIVGAAMYTYSESAESLNKKGLPYKAVDANANNWVDTPIDLQRTWTNKYSTDEKGLCTITKVTQTELHGKYTSTLDFSYNACWEIDLTLPDGDVFEPYVTFFISHENDNGSYSPTEMQVNLLRDGEFLSRNRTLSGWQTLQLNSWKKSDTGTRQYYIRFFPLYSPTNFVLKELTLSYTTEYNTTSVSLKGGALRFRDVDVSAGNEHQRYFGMSTSTISSSQTNTLLYQRPLSTLGMPPHFVGTTNQLRVLQRRSWEWWPGKLDNPTEWFEYDAQGFYIGENMVPTAEYAGLYWVAFQATVENNYSDLWISLLVELNPAQNWPLAVGDMVMLEPNVKKAKVSCAGMMQLRTNRQLNWHFAIRTPDMKNNDSGWITITNTRLSAMYISN